LPRNAGFFAWKHQLLGEAIPAAVAMFIPEPGIFVTRHGGWSQIDCHARPIELGNRLQYPPK
jgi:hypothetical protein